eukprot:6910805-Pyramimonas_sp.AAC.1
MLAATLTTTTARPATAPMLIAPATMSAIKVFGRSSTCARDLRARVVRAVLFGRGRAPSPPSSARARKSVRKISARGARGPFGRAP